MKLPHELTGDKAASFALAWSVSWRFFVLFVAAGLLYALIPAAIRVGYPLLSTIATMALIFACFWLWVHRLLARGIGRVRIIFMEREHYDGLLRELEEREQP